MANPNKVWGRTRIRIGGEVIDTEGKSTLDPGGIKRSPVQGDYRTGMFSEESADAKIECSVLLTGSVSLIKLGQIDDAVATFECDTGQTYVVNHAYVSEPPQASDGKAKLTIMGQQAEEMRA